MNNNLFFLCLALAVLILSAVTIIVAPIINSADSSLSSWGTQNCQQKKDIYNYKNKNNQYTKGEKKVAKREVDECFSQNAMHDLEYTSLIMDVVFGFICTILGFLHYYEVGKQIEKISGLIGLITGAIITIITFIYFGYSASLFNNGVVRGLNKLYSNKATYKWKDGKYTHNYDEDKLNDDPDVKHPRYRDVGKKQYNYNSEYYILYNIYNSEVSKCIYSSITNLNIKKENCDYIWSGNYENIFAIPYKYIHDRWLTSIIISFFVVVCGIGLAFFGFLLFKNSGGSSGHVPVK